MRRSFCLITSLLVALVPAAAVAGPVGAAPGDRPPTAAAQAAPSRPEPVPGELVVRFDTSRAGVDPGAGTDRAVADVGGRVSGSFDSAAPGLRHVVLDEGVDAADAIAELERRDDVLYAEPNFVFRAAATANDSRLGELWGLHNTGQTVDGVAGTADADIDAPEA